MNIIAEKEHLFLLFVKRVMQPHQLLFYDGDEVAAAASAAVAASAAAAEVFMKHQIGCDRSGHLSHNSPESPRSSKRLECFP